LCYFWDNIVLADGYLPVAGVLPRTPVGWVAGVADACFYAAFAVGPEGELGRDYGSTAPLICRLNPSSMRGCTRRFISSGVKRSRSWAGVGRSMV